MKTKAKRRVKSYAPTTKQVPVGDIPIFEASVYGPEIHEPNEKPKVLVIGSHTVSDAIRLGNPGLRVAKKLDLTIDYINPEDVTGLDFVDYDIFLIARPSPESIPIIQVAKRRHIPVIVDWDDDFMTIPEWHPGYKGVGPGNPKIKPAVMASIINADVLTVASKELQARYGKIREQTLGKNDIIVVPNTWNNENPYWSEPRKKDRPFTFGWCGTITHRKDFAHIVSPLCEFLDESPGARIVVGGDEQIYEMLKSVRERQKVYVPTMDYKYYPIMLSLFDVLLAPLENDEFNQVKSNIKLVDAAASGIPYIASPLPQYKDWPIGCGLLADTQDEWLEDFNLLYEPHEHNPYETLAMNSKNASKDCETETIIPLWIEMFLRCGYDFTEAVTPTSTGGSGE